MCSTVEEKTLVDKRHCLAVPAAKDMVSEFSSSSLVKYCFFPQNNKKKIGHIGSFSLVFLFVFCQISHGDPIYAGL